MLFKNKRLNRDKLQSCGFEVNGENFIIRQKFLSDFTLTITISNGEVITRLVDADGEPYTLHLVEGASGSFVGNVKAEYERALNELAAQCFDDEPFKSARRARGIESACRRREILSRLAHE